MKILKGLIFLLLISNLCFCQELPLLELTKDDFQIEYAGTKIPLRQSYGVIASERVGGRESWDGGDRYKLTDRGSLFVILEVFYPGLKIAFSYDCIEKIEITDKQTKTARNISVGMSESEVTKVYGKPHDIIQGATGGKRLVYRMKVDSVFIISYELVFEIVNQAVRNIILQVDYDEKKVLTLEDFSIVSNDTKNGYHVLQKIAEIAKDFSEKPQVTTTLYNKGTKYETEVQQYQFGNAFFTTSDYSKEINKLREISDIVVNGNGWATRRGIVVGDSKEKVLQTYGTYGDWTILHQKGKHILHYIFNNFGMEEVYGRVFYPDIQGLVLDFTIENDKVKEIKLSYLVMGN